MRFLSRLIHRIAHRRRLRRYRKVVYIHKDLRGVTEAPFVTRLWRYLFQEGYSGKNRRVVRVVARIRFAIMLLLGWMFIWFVMENLFLWDFFSGE
ncbi:MAG: hypothetical protein LBD01_06755 [Puniceicoccales bacterium]|jgi:hypothetical protein|nr:hypothetical protein [Puniceicoccales bacterium]